MTGPVVDERNEQLASWQPNWTHKKDKETKERKRLGVGLFCQKT
jgi:hypothetical protein